MTLILGLDGLFIDGKRVTSQEMQATLARLQPLAAEYDKVKAAIEDTVADTTKGDV